MPITAVSPTPIPSPGQPLPNPADLSTWPIRMAEMHRWMRETLSPGVEQIGDESYTNALAAQDAAVIAYANANFKGAWSALTGALAVPSLVSHDGERWNLLSNLADVTSSEPGVGAEWELFELPAASGVGFDPTGTSMTGTNVQAALVEVSAVADEALIDFVNPVLNGAMRIAQAGTSFALTTGFTRTIDGCGYAAAGSSAVTVSQQSAATPNNQNAKWMIATVTTSDSSISSSDYSFLTCILEGYDIAEYRGKTFTLGFFVKSSVTGSHSVALLNYDASMRYIASFNIEDANTPQFVSVTIEGGIPDSGTWNYGSGLGLRIDFALAAGSINQSTTGAWASGGQFASSSQVNVLATIGNVFGVTEVQINPGSVAKKFKMPSYQSDLERCQRYYEAVDTSFGPTSASTLGRVGFWKVEKRITPAVSYLNYVAPGSSATCSFAPSAIGASKTSFRQSSIGNSGTVDVETSVIGDARL